MPVFRLVDLRAKTQKSKMYSVFEAAQLNFEQCKEDYLSIAKRQLPFLMLHAEDDFAVEKERAIENMELFNLNADDTVRYDRNGECSETFPGTKLQRVVWFEKGGHRLQISWPEIVCQHIASLISVVNKK
ncbi:uncharacterized protein [Ptychodera flava]|uniref:uncharacterized protein n=1 Tax=Ptychodera flava TaxID=63121 RepID=UPI00396A970F